MAGSGDIVQNIVLAGQSDVIAGLNAIGSAGVQAFSSLSEAASSISLSAPLGAITGFTAAIATVTAGFFEWSAAASNATIRTANFGDELGTSAQQMTTLITALAQGGNQVTDLTTSFRRLAVSVESEWPAIQKSVRNATNLMKEDYIKVGEANVALQFSGEKLSEQQQRDALDVQKATLGVAEAKQNLAKSDKDSAIQMQANAVDVLSAEGQLSAALFALDHAKKPATKSEREDQAEQQAGIAALQAQIALQRAVKKQQEEQTEAALKHRQAVLQIAEAEERLREAQTKAAEDAALAPLRQQKAELDAAKARSEEREHQANDIANLKQYVDNLASGASNADSKVQLSSANLVKGLIASVGPGVTALDEFKGSLGDLGLAAPKLYDVMLKVSDIFKNTTDETLRAAIATALFGRGYSFSLVEALSKGSEAIKASQAQIEQTFDLTKGRVEEQVAVAREFRSALNTLGEGISLVSKQISTIITPTFSTVLRGIESAVEANRTKFLEWASAIRDSLQPAIVGFVSSLTGINLSNAFNLSPEQILKAAEWKQQVDTIKGYIVTAFNGVKDFLTSTLPAAFSIVMGGFNAIAAVINTFGGNVSGAEIAIALLIGQFTGLNNAIIAATIAIGGLVLALAANPFGLIVIGVVAAIAALTALGVVIYKNRDAINEWLNTKVSGAFNWIADAFEDVMTRIRRELSAIDKDIKDMLLFKSLSTRQAENADIQKKNAAEDADTQQRRAFRDQPADEGYGLGSLNQPSETDKKVLTQEDAYKSLGETIETAFDKAKKAMGGLGDQSKSTGDQARKAAQDILDQARATENSAQKQQDNSKKTAEQEKQEQDKALKDAKTADDEWKQRTGNFAGRGFARSINPVNPDAVSPQQFEPTVSRETAERQVRALSDAARRDRQTQQQRIEPGLPGGPEGPLNPESNQRSKESFRKDLDNSIQDLKDDWKSQRELNAQLHNGSFESRTVGTQASPQARTPSGVSQVYPPAVRGHYDDNYNFVPDVPTDSGLGRGSVAGPGVSGGSIPRTNDYDFAGRRNPAGPYQEGISTPLSFPQYNADRQQNLPSEYPQGVPLPTPRPPEANVPTPQGTQQQIQVPGLQELGAKLQDFVTQLVQPKTPETAAPETNNQQQASGTTDQLMTALQTLAQSVTDAAQQIASAAASVAGDISEAPGHAEGGKIGGKPGRDTNLIWASRDEFMMQESAVAHYGEGFMNAVNQKRLPKRWFGGMISSAAHALNHGMIPKYETGGPIHVSSPSAISSGPTHSVSFHAPDGREIGRGMGDRDIVNGIHAFATAHSRYSTGRAQSWRSGS